MTLAPLRAAATAAASPAGPPPTTTTSERATTVASRAGSWIVSGIVGLLVAARRQNVGGVMTQSERTGSSPGLRYQWGRRLE